MRYETIEKILTGKQRGKKTTKRIRGEHGLVMSKFSVDADSIVITANEDGSKNHVMIDADHHHKGSDIKVSIIPRSSGDSVFGFVQFFAEQDMRGDYMDDIDHDENVFVTKQTGVYLDVDDLVALRDEINREIRKAKRKDLI